jgi:hypothetical protein
MIVEVWHNDMRWWFYIKGKNGKIFAKSSDYRNRVCLMRAVNKITNTVCWKIHEGKW